MQSRDKQVRLDSFEADRSYLHGRGRLLHAVWYFTSCVFFATRIPWPSRLKARILRLFGAEVGRSVVIKHDVQIHVPWNLELGDHVWVGHGCVLLNFAKITICSHSALAHEVYLAAAGHDHRLSSMPYAHAPITIASSAWLATRSMVTAGVTIGEGCVVAAGAVVTGDTRPWTIVGGIPATEIGERHLDD